MSQGSNISFSLSFNSLKLTVFVVVFFDYCKCFLAILPSERSKILACQQIILFKKIFYLIWQIIIQLLDIINSFIAMRERSNSNNPVQISSVINVYACEYR